MTIRTALIPVLTAVLMASPVVAAESAKETCGYQADVVAAIQQARLDRVKERDLSDVLITDETSWPENYNAAIPLIAPWIYDQKMKVIRNEDLGAVWNEQCLAQSQ
ncbi:hypothetical protein [Parasedimentitalea maritima]|uniref:Uncharacterized protein n=1 Tax=Parasedimentitalea maritima TaxID=2578117 RepID=A0A6A4R830_9RHOB|nr:hypothetical protein [Zongyanglinia marina]KAE9627903.1 hypothetical protein GP644_17555 [Zongyanglinia marina]